MCNVRECTKTEGTGWFMRCKCKRTALSLSIWHNDTLLRCQQCLFWCTSEPLPKVDDDTLEKVTAYFTSDYTKYKKMQGHRIHMNHSKMKWSQVNKRTHKQHDASTDLWRLKKDPVDFQDRVKTHTECNSWLMDSLWHGQCGGPAPIMRSLIKLFFVTPPFSQSSMISLWLFQQYPHWPFSTFGMGGV